MSLGDSDLGQVRPDAAIGKISSFLLYIDLDFFVILV